MPTIEQRDAIINFFEAAKNLEKKEIIKSSRFSGDIGEFLCKKLFNLKLCENQRQLYYDGYDSKDKLVQVKINNSRTKTNQYIGNKEKYDFLYLLITKNSYLFNTDYSDSGAFILIYIIPKDRLPDKLNIAKKEIEPLKPDLYLNRNFEVMEFKKLN